jgi:hypothetical protein
VTDGPVTYEVNLVPDASIENEFDEWLDAHVVDMLRLPGFLTAVVRRAEDADGGIQRTVQYELRDRDALDAYLRDHAARMRQHGLDRFGDRFRASRRILDHGHRLSAAGSEGGCANCEAPLAGQYCAVCGQRSRTRMITLWQLLREVSEVLTTLDSRLWRTLSTLLFRPGRLTADYLKGRRARYAPPLRLFLGASIVFFFAVALGERLDLDGSVGFVVTDDGDLAALEGEGATPPGGPNITVHMGEPAGNEGGTGAAAVPRDPAGGEAVAPEPAPADAADEAAADPTTANGEGAGEEDEDPCGDIDVSLDSDMAWLGTYLTQERLEGVCRKIIDDHGASFGRALLDNIPIMMFLFLPLMAVVMKGLYLFTGRYYVEHLLFLVHFHAFFYLAVTIALIAGWVFTGRALPEWPGDLLGLAIGIYVPIYLYRGLRVVYEQGRAATLFKYFGLGIAYFVALLIMFLLTAAVTAFTL